MKDDLEPIFYIYPDGSVFYSPQDWMSDIVPHYAEPFASCECMTQEWYK